MTEKLIRDGKVAVLYSPGYGAGWSTWSSNNSEAMVFCPELAAAVLSGNKELSRKIAEDKFPEACQGGVHQLAVEWIESGIRFSIYEFDGSECVHILGRDIGYLA